MNLKLNLKTKIVTLSFLFFIFFWSFSIYENFQLRYFIIIPFILSFLEKDNFSNINFKFFVLIPIFLITHYILTNFINSTSFYLRDFLSIIFLTIVVYTFLIYRLLIIKEFANILKLYFIILVIFSLVSNKSMDVGSCSASLYQLFPMLKILPLSKGFFLENSHLAIMNIGSIISGIFICFKKKDLFLLTLVILSLIINLLNISTTFILGYILCSILFILITKKKFFQIFLAVTSIIFFVFFYQSYDCNKKYKSINIEDIKNENIERKKAGELTASIYERSIILSLRTLKNNPLGWGYDGTIKATKEYFIFRENKNLFIEKGMWELNLRDALGNIFKLTIEFGFFTIILFFLFVIYLKRIKITEFEIFIISLFVVQLFRGAGYINGGFILALTEIFILKYLIINNRHLKRKSPNFF